MTRNVLQLQAACIDGFMHDLVEYPDYQILTSPSLIALDKMRRGRRILEVKQDHQGKYWIPAFYKTHDDFKNLGFIKNTPITTGLTIYVRSEDIDGNDIPCTP